MTRDAATFDVEGLAGALLKAVPGLIGRDCPLLALHLSDDARSPQRGAIAVLAVTGSPTVDEQGLGHTARITFTVRAIGGEKGAKQQAQRAAGALATELRSYDGGAKQPVVDLDGVQAKLVWVETVYGPTWVGVPRGESTYRVDGTFVWQVP